MMEIVVVPDEQCPRCGKGAEDGYPNRPKVALDDGVWWWRCYNPECGCYYNPETGEVEV